MSNQAVLNALVVLIYVLLIAIVAIVVREVGMPFGIRSRALYVVMLVLSPVVVAALLLWGSFQGGRAIAKVIVDGWNSIDAETKPEAEEVAQ